MFRRGFKSWAEQTALRVRQKLKLPATAPIDPYKLADLLAVLIVKPDELGGGFLGLLSGRRPGIAPRITGR